MTRRARRAHGPSVPLETATRRTANPRADDGQDRRQQRQRGRDRETDDDRPGDPDRPQDHELEEDESEQAEQDREAREEHRTAGRRDRHADSVRDTVRSVRTRRQLLAEPARQQQ